MKKTYIYLLVLLGIFVAHTAFAGNAIISASPVYFSKTAGLPFNISITVDPAGNKVCVVKGSLAFSNLSCQSITVEPGLITQTVPTCASPNFMIGIPKCATSTMNILSVSVKGEKAGSAMTSFTGVNVIGAGTVLAADEKSGSYTITAQPTQPKVTPKPVTTVPTATALVPTPAETTPAVTATPPDNATPPTSTSQPTVVPPTAAAADLSGGMRNVLTNPFILIIAGIIAILILLWYFKKPPFDGKENSK